MILETFVHPLVSVTLPLLAVVCFLLVISWAIHSVIYLIAVYLGRRYLLITGVIGIPVHELSHLIVNLLFAHKILGVSFFQMQANNNTLGYVNYAYNPASYYQQIGRFFAGIAPLIIGPLVILVAAYYLLSPQQLASLHELYVNHRNMISIAHFSANQMTEYLSMLKQLLGVFWVFEWYNFVFLFLAGCIALHIAPSKQDFFSSLSALGLLILTVTALSLLSTELTHQLYKWIMVWLLLIVIISAWAVCLAGIILITSFVLKLVKNTLFSYRG